MDNITTDLMFRIYGIRLAEAQSKVKTSFSYLFNWESPLEVPSHGKIGAAHAVEIPFVFGTLEVPGMNMFIGSGEKVENLSNLMMDSWISFAKTGNPNHQGIPQWSPYDEKDRSTMILGKDIKLIKDPYQKTRIAWNGII